MWCRTPAPLASYARTHTCMHTHTQSWTVKFIVHYRIYACIQHVNSSNDDMNINITACITLHAYQKGVDHCIVMVVLNQLSIATCKSYWGFSGEYSRHAWYELSSNSLHVLCSPLGVVRFVFSETKHIPSIKAVNMGLLSKDLDWEWIAICEYNISSFSDAVMSYHFICGGLLWIKVALCSFQLCVSLQLL